MNKVTDLEVVTASPNTAKIKLFLRSLFSLYQPFPAAASQPGLGTAPEHWAPPFPGSCFCHNLWGGAGPSHGATANIPSPVSSLETQRAFCCLPASSQPSILFFHAWIEDSIPLPKVHLSPYYWIEQQILHFSASFPWLDLGGHLVHCLLQESPKCSFGRTFPWKSFRKRVWRAMDPPWPHNTNSLDSVIYVYLHMHARKNVCVYLKV